MKVVTKKLVTLSSLVAAFGALTGCMTQNEYYDQYDSERVEFVERSGVVDAYEGNLDLLAGHMRGDVGNVRDIDSNASLLTGYGDTEYASVELHADTRSGVAMNLLDIYGGLDALEPGLVQTFRSSDDIDYGALNVQVLNCAGQARYSWDYDQPADEVQVRVSEADEPGALRVNYTARTFDVDPFTGLQTGGVSEVAGSFDVAR